MQSFQEMLLQPCLEAGSLVACRKSGSSESTRALLGACCALQNYATATAV